MAFNKINYNSIFNHQSNTNQDRQKIKMKNSHKIKVKRLKNSPYAIQEGEPLGKGSFATIQRAYNLDNMSEELAVKIISIHDEETSKTVKSELQMLKELPAHPNLVNCMKIQISSERNFYIIMEYCNQGNLQKYIFDHKNDLSEEKIWFFLKQFCDGYKVLYDRNIIHRDIKPQNILIKNGNFKISDFGLARVITNVEFSQNLSSKGTPLYMAPQIHCEKEGSSKVDVFSLGIILYRLAFRGKFPFFQNGRTYHSVAEYFKELMIKKLTFPAKHNRSHQLVNLIERMLVKNQNDRISWKQIFAIERIKRAVRNERRKEMIPMEEFRKSLLIVANCSTTDAKVLQSQASDSNAQSDSKEDEAILIIEEAFNKKNKSKIEKKLYRNKLIYTLIDIANRRILNTLISENKRIHPYIGNQLDNIVNTGMLFCIHLIQKLENMSGDWHCIPTGEILNFEDIFENDRDIIVEKLKNKSVNYEEKYREGSYEILLYNILTQYHDYPKEIQKILLVSMGFLVDIYDLVIKINQKEEENLDDEDHTNIKVFQDSDVEKFQQYLYSLENVKMNDVNAKMKKMGLLIL